MRRSLPLVAAALTLLTAAHAQRVVRVTDLVFEEYSAPDLDAGRLLGSTAGRTLLPRAHSGGRALFVGTPQVRSGLKYGALRETWIALPREVDDATPSGVLYLSDDAGERLLAHPFRAPAAAVTVDEERWRDTVARHYLALAGTGLPGVPWFRRQAVAHGGDLENVGRFGSRRGFGTEDSFAMFTGGRALAENLALDDVIERDGDDDAPGFPIDGIDGVNVPEMKFDRLLPAAAPELDPLAELVPHDQHAVFFPTFDALVRTADGLEDEARPLVSAFDGRGVVYLVRERYERQMLLDLGPAARALGGALVRSAAVTGSDPYMRTGTDVALLLAGSGDAAYGAIRAQIEARAVRRGVARADSTLRGIAVASWSTEDRSTSCWMAAAGNVVVVANSEVQLDRVLACAGGAEALAALPEYHWFRHRYPRDASGAEDAFVVLSDAAIRRWSGPFWRIATARRTHAGALLADADAWRIASRNGTATGDTPAGRTPIAGGGTLDLTGRFARDSNYGTRDFLTPISELEIRTVTKAERDGYLRWRRRFERSWGGTFDPIAASIDLRADGLDLDLTLVPLVVRSDYRMLIEFAGNQRLGPDAAGPHAGALVFWSTALDPLSQLTRSIVSLASEGGEPPAERWIGEDLAVWLDDDADYFARIAEMADVDEFVDELLPGLPIGVSVSVVAPEIADRVVADFLRMFDVSAGFSLEVDERTHRDQSYFAVRPEEELDEISEVPTLFVAVTPRSLVLSLSEGVVRRKIERDTAPFDQTPWLGRSTGLRVDGAVEKLLANRWLAGSARAQLRARSWGSLPVLNEWKRLGFADPVAAHEAEWGTRLVCPGGGTYRWNAQAGTMESTVYGHPGAPKEGPLVPPGLERLRSIDCALDFERFAVDPAELREGEVDRRRRDVRGLRARVSLRRR
ncbi:MAG: hypothetical protein AAFR54_16160 [Planctomycetota bacterium]